MKWWSVLCVCHEPTVPSIERDPETATRTGPQSEGSQEDTQTAKPCGSTRMEIGTSKCYNALNEDSDKRPRRGPGDDAAGYGDFFSQDRNRLRTCAPKNLDWRHYYTDHKAILDYLKFSMPSKNACHEPASQRECRGARREEQAKGSREATREPSPAKAQVETATSNQHNTTTTPGSRPQNGF